MTRTSTEERRARLAAAHPKHADDFAEINWFHTVLLTVTPALALYGYLTTPLTLPTAILAVVWYFATGLGITAGYHRLFSHRAYEAVPAVRTLLLAFGAAAFQGSAAWWCKNHRLHHTFTDTPKDPYNVHKGFWWAHLGWMITKQEPSAKARKADVRDLKADPAVCFQHKNYVAIAIVVGVVIPTALGALWGDVWGAFFYGCMMRMVFIHHATFFVNSLAHTIGARPYSRLNSARDSVITALLTLGEGYHAWHHTFHTDYRNGIHWYDYDPTKHLIYVLSLFGLTYNLRRVDDEEVERAREYITSGYCHQPPQDESKPPVALQEFFDRVAQGEALMVIEGMVYDVKPFALTHPGGYNTLLSAVGTDATSVFRGEERAENDALNRHTQEARAILKKLVIGRLDGLYRIPADVSAAARAARE